jgi:nicotinamide-nucleotide amidase
MKPYSYGIDEDTLEGILGGTLIDKKLTIAIAESCTGGLIGKRLTDTAGSSDYFLGSITAYSNKLKRSLLDVSEKTLNKNGAVSREVALEMARGIRSKTNADIGLSTTGISGPDGATKNKPLGLVYIGLVTSNKSLVKKFNLDYDRHIHREMTATAALNLTRKYIE